VCKQEDLSVLRSSSILFYWNLETAALSIFIIIIIIFFFMLSVENNCCRLTSTNIGLFHFGQSFKFKKCYGYKKVSDKNFTYSSCC
jgi:hypothetical protein